MMEVVVPGILFGLMSNFHCIGMCGPFALSLPLQNKPGFIKALSVAAYQLGRISTYTALGAVFGYFGRSITLSGLQQSISIGAGILILLTVLIPKLGFKLRQLVPVNKFLSPLLKYVSYFYKNQSVGGYFLIGNINGMFPCGMVYLAIAAAFSTGNVLSSTIFMAAFGLGTLPAMLTVSIMGQWMSMSLRDKFNRITPYFFALVGVLLILRGLGLNIPYVSPSLEVPPIGVREVDCM